MKRWLPVGLWLMVIFIGSSIPNVPSIGTHTVDSWVHRVAHVAEYTVLGWLLMRALANGQPLSRRTAAITLVIVIAYGFSDEFHQRFTPGRNSDAVAVLGWLLLRATASGR
ncbi:MAG: VanZ family protein [Anaerolineae bacterium]